eukprot:755156-Hanusia_phi.AAC.2
MRKDKNAAICPNCNPSSEKERLSNNVTNKDVTANQVAQQKEADEEQVMAIVRTSRLRRSAKYGHPEQETSPDEERRWVAVVQVAAPLIRELIFVQSENAYGAFIHVAIQVEKRRWRAKSDTCAFQRGVLTGILKCGPMLVASVVLQMIFALELFYALPSISSRKT